MTCSSELFLEAKTSVVFCSQKRVMGVHEPFAFLFFLLLLFKCSPNWLACWLCVILRRPTRVSIGLISVTKQPQWPPPSSSIWARLGTRAKRFPCSGASTRREAQPMTFPVLEVNSCGADIGDGHHGRGGVWTCRNLRVNKGTSSD